MIPIAIPKINEPRIVYGNNGQGLGRGPAKKGDVVGKEPKPGEPGRAGKGEREGIQIDIDLEEILDMLAQELELPDLKDKPKHVFEDVKIKYNNISKTGPNSLLHGRRTMKEAMKRLAASGTAGATHQPPGFSQPIRQFSLINADRRYRQWREIVQPSSNAVVIFSRDGSGSMTQAKCEIISDIAWWMETWIRRFYKRTETMYIWHDFVAQEVDQRTFYGKRDGGGTLCSTAFQLAAQAIEDRFPPATWNVYHIYFTDGDNWGDDDNAKVNEIIAKNMDPRSVNMMGIVQIMPYGWGGKTLKEAIDGYGHKPNVRTIEIKGGNGGWDASLPEDQRDAQIKRVLKELLGRHGANSGPDYLEKQAQG